MIPIGSSLMHIVNYFNATTKKYLCDCPTGITGDRCETCVSISNKPRFMQSPGRCADCDCSEFSESIHCDMNTGQCPCIQSEFSGDKNLVDRQCNSFISEIHPLYGPAVGRTTITVTGGYLISQNVSRIRFALMDIPSDLRSLLLPIQAISTTRVVFSTPPYMKEIGSVKISIPISERRKDQSALPTSAYPGRTKFYVFNYRPNPVIEAISPHNTFLSGGTNVTVAGRFLDSVYTPIMIIYMRLQETPIFTFNSSCQVTNGTLMMCPTPRMVENITAFLSNNSVNASYGWEHLKDFKFTTGFLFDGLDHYRDLLLSTNMDLKRQAEITVEMDQFKSIGVVEFKPQHNKSLQMKDEGLINEAANIWNNNEAFRGGISFLAALLILLVILIPVLLYVYKKREAHRTRKNLRVTRNIIQDDALVIEPFLVERVSGDLLLRISSCKIPKENLSIGQQLGEGFFGQVYKGQLIMKNGNQITVAIKTFRDDHEISIDDLENLLREVTITMDFKHQNVLSLIGIVWDESERPLVVLPYMENGDLRSMLRKPNQEYSLGDQLHFAFQISNGMSYLADSKFVHRDLAARNCVVSAEYIVKIADFGLSRDVYEKDYYRMDQKNKPLPVKWMAIESLKEGVYSTKSDVWSFGITMWELLTRGKAPYPGISINCIKEYLVEGKRLDQPTRCPDAIFQLMCRCWNENPEERPTFAALSSELREMIELSLEMTEYDRIYTKDIPHDYISLYQCDESEYYMVPTKAGGTKE